MKKIYIELSDICHLACSFCPAPKGVRGVMSLEAFAHALDSALMLTKRIALHILGDPCALPNLADYLTLAHSKGAEIELVTSGAFFHKHRPQTLLSPPVYQLSISLEAGIDNAIANYATKLAPLLAYHLQHPSCFLNLRVQDSSLYQNPQALCTLLRQILPESTFTPTHNAYHHNHHQAYHQKFCHALSRNDIHTLFDEKGRIRLWSKAFLIIKPHFTWAGFATMPQKHKSCHALTQQIGILSDGTIVPCCMDTQGAINLGNITQTSLQEALRSPRAVAMKNGFKTQRAVESLCQYCGFVG